MAGMRRFSRVADAQSKETTYSGLPKATKMWRNGQSGFTQNVWGPCAFDRLTYNYGGYAFTAFIGALWTEVIVPESGIYTVMASASQAVVPAGAYFWAAIYQNGVQPPPFNQVKGEPDANGNAVIVDLCSENELKQGDRISLNMFCTFAGGLDITGHTSLSIRKEGGQY